MKTKKSQTKAESSKSAKTLKAKKASTKVYKAKPIRAKRAKIVKSSSKKTLTKRGKKQNLMIRILKKPITYVPVAGLAALGAFAIINLNHVPTLEEVQKTVVQLEVCNDYEYSCGSGSGFAAFKDNYLVTNYHVIAGADTIKVKTAEDVEGKVTNILIFDPVKDIAIVEWDHTLPKAMLSSSENVNVGDKVLAIGNPLSETNVVSEGIISSKNSEHGLMTTAAISPGSSGGALILDSDHKVIGVTYLKKTNGESMNYAIKIEDVTKVYEDYQKQNYHYINSNTSDSCHTTLDKIALSVDALDFSGCKDSQTDNYSASSLSVFYDVTNRRTRFEHALIERTDWKVLYDRLSSSIKNQLVDNISSTHSTAFDTNWKYIIWYANEHFYYTCQTDMCMVRRYIDGYYPTSNSEFTTGTETDLEKL